MLIGELSRQLFEKNPQTSIFMKIRPVGAELFHADRQTDGRTDGRTDRQTGMVSRFSQFFERTYNALEYRHISVGCELRVL
jgi:hypothetical protein